MISFFVFKAWWSVWKVSNYWSWKTKLETKLKLKRILLKNGNIWECILGNNRFVSKYFQFILNIWLLEGYKSKVHGLSKNKRSWKIQYNCRTFLLKVNRYSNKTIRSKRCITHLLVDRVLFINGHILLFKTVYFVGSYNFISNNGLWLAESAI